MMPTVDRIREQAELIARENREGNPDIERVLWFPAEDEVRLVEITQQVPTEADGRIHPFYFPARPQDGMDAISAIALIRPEEFKKLRLPEDWGDWAKAEEL